MTGSLLSIVKDLHIHPSNTGGWHGLYTDTGFSGLTSGSDVFGTLDGLAGYVPNRILAGIKKRVGWLILTDTELQTQYQQTVGSFSALTLSPHSIASHMVALRNDKWKATGLTVITHELMHCISDEYPLWGTSGTTLAKSEPFWTPWQKIDAACNAGTIIRAGQYGWVNYDEFLAVSWEYHAGYNYSVSTGNPSGATTYLNLKNGLWPSSAGVTQTERDAAWAFFDALTVPLTLPSSLPGYTPLH